MYIVHVGIRIIARASNIKASDYRVHDCQSQKKLNITAVRRSNVARNDSSLDCIGPSTS